MTDVAGRTAFITGGANGIGLGIARRLARAGARLALVDMDVAALDRARQELKDLTEVEVYRLDVRDRAAYASVATEVESALGPVSLLFNNAGVVTTTPVTKLSYALWDWSTGVNLYGVINGIQIFLRGMVERGAGGHIVNTASGAGLAAVGSGVLYSTAKFGVVGMSESLHGELKCTGIGVSVLCPGSVATGIIERSANDAPPPDAPLSAEQEQRVAKRRRLIDEVLQQGTSADKVGELVLRAVLDNELYIHTDRMMEEPIKARAAAILDAMPLCQLP
ncbi:SDR family NAD(P)-dependent oxidoreductase [Solimonas terrae]|uniref:SDR family NAD(P)-dependent oxidoreductase n=1 Tax=Solimonas terrae TaxID=1396819 RepID=A0A6M2BKT3_9GAMM|nr:SDR family NAD(P)-dependent oxidoreductase [Solimonas terrae]NGY03336.1 SDR family NAD(P)-dependent oxidoreductase [Solimonas terrae]